MSALPLKAPQSLTGYEMKDELIDRATRKNIVVPSLEIQDLEATRVSKRFIPNSVEGVETIFCMDGTGGFY
jgi:hypothetical protein